MLGSIQHMTENKEFLEGLVTRFLRLTPYMKQQFVLPISRTITDNNSSQGMQRIVKTMTLKKMLHPTTLPDPYTASAASRCCTLCSAPVLSMTSQSSQLISE